MWGVLDYARLLQLIPLYCRPNYFVEGTNHAAVHYVFPSTLCSFCSYIRSLLSTLFLSILSLAFFLRIWEFNVWVYRSVLSCKFNRQYVRGNIVPSDFVIFPLNQSTGQIFCCCRNILYYPVRIILIRESFIMLYYDTKMPLKYLCNFASYWLQDHWG